MDPNLHEVLPASLLAGPEPSPQGQASAQLPLSLGYDGATPVAAWAVGDRRPSVPPLPGRSSRASRGSALRVHGTRTALCPGGRSLRDEQQESGLRRWPCRQRARSPRPASAPPLGTGPADGHTRQSRRRPRTVRSPDVSRRVESEKDSSRGAGKSQRWLNPSLTSVSSPTDAVNDITAWRGTEHLTPGR